MDGELWIRVLVMAAAMLAGAIAMAWALYVACLDPQRTDRSVGRHRPERVPGRSVPEAARRNASGHRYEWPVPVIEGRS